MVDLLDFGGIETEISLFSGAGGGVLGARLAKVKTLAYCEWDEFCQGVLKARMADGVFEQGDVSGDVRAMDVAAFKGKVDAVTAGFPCFVKGTLIRCLGPGGTVIQKPIEMVKVGDLVYTHLERWRRVTAVMSREGAATRRIQLAGMPGTETTDEHPYRCQIGAAGTTIDDMKFLWAWIPAKDLQIGQRVAAIGDLHDQDFRLPEVEVNELTGHTATVHNIAVEEDESYVANGAMVHNCQPFSVAGKQMGDDDPRNMWPATLRILNEVQPKWGLLENVPGLLAGKHGYFGTIMANLLDSGWNAVWDCVPASAVGAAHRRDRLWIVAWPAKLDQKLGYDDLVGVRFAERDKTGAWVVSGGVEAMTGRAKPWTKQWPLAGAVMGNRAVALPPMSRQPGNRLGKWPVPHDLTHLGAAAEILAAAFTEAGDDEDEVFEAPAPTDEQLVWPTPNARDYKGPPGAGTRARGGRGASLPASVSDRMWPTPLAGNATAGEGGNHGGMALTQAARELWPTPTVGDAEGGRTTSKGKDVPTSLNAAVRGLIPRLAVRQWPTPLAGQVDGSGSPPGGVPLIYAALGTPDKALSFKNRAKAAARRLWPTPTAFEGNSIRPGMSEKYKRPLNDAVRAADQERPQMWPTPMARSWQSPDFARTENRSGKRGLGDDLQTVVALREGLGPEGRKISFGPGSAKGQMVAGRLQGKPDVDRQMWPTPTAQDTGRTPEEYLAMRQGMAGGPRRSVSSLAVATQLAERTLWPTPQAHDAAKGNAGRVGRHGTAHGGRDLNDWVAKWPDGPPGDPGRKMWPTPTTMDGMRGGKADDPAAWRIRQAAKAGQGINLHLPLNVAVKMDAGTGAPTADGMWPTPTAATNRKSSRALTSSAANGGGGRRKDGGGQSSPLGLEQMVELADGVVPVELAGIAVQDLPPATVRTMAVARSRQMWPTPTASDSDKGSPNARYGSGSMGLTATAHARQHLWPTPTALGGIMGGNGAPMQMRALIQAGMVSEADAQTMFGRSARNESRAGHILPPEFQPDPAAPKASPGSLNADWVEWLMGWPIGWTRGEPVSEQAMADWWRGMADGTWWLHEPAGIPRIVKGQSQRARRLKAIGNGQVPLCAFAAFQALIALARQLDNLIEAGDNRPPIDLFDLMDA